MKRFALSTTLAIGLAASCAAAAHAGVTIEFPQSSYQIQPGGTLQLSVVLDFDNSTPIFEAAPNAGLADYRFQMVAPATNAAITGFSVPSQFTWNDGIKPSPQVDASKANILDLWGNIDFLDGFLGNDYKGTTLATITLHDLGTAPGGQYTLSLAKSSAWDIDTDTEVLTYDVDAFTPVTLTTHDVTFGTTQINVAAAVPEPASLALLTIGALGLLRRKLRTR